MFGGLDEAPLRVVDEDRCQGNFDDCVAEDSPYRLEG